MVNAAVVCAAIAGCSLAVDADRVQCSTDADCHARGPDFANTECIKSVCQAIETTMPDAGIDPPSEHMDAGAPTSTPGQDSGPPLPPVDDSLWSCMDRPAAMPSGTGPFHVTFAISDIIKPMMPPAGVEAQLCRKLDPDCAQPVGAKAMSDSTGHVSFDVERAFTGFATFTHKDYAAGLYFFNPAVNSNLENVPVQLVPPNIVQALTGTLHTSQMPDRGIILLNVANCNGTSATGVAYETDAPLTGATPFYSLGGVPNSDAKATDSAGYGGYVNVLPGSVGVKGVILGTKREIPLLSLYVRAGAITYSKLVPLGR